jgi:pimeloyl-ACP methyl ester carboxylesterase
MSAFVLAHGSWWGGWSWGRVAARLRRAGHVVHTPSYTGMGNRAHLLGPAITIETFVEDLIGVIESEELSEVVLVGHSFGGVPISGVADRIPERIAKLIYLDAVVLERGTHAFSMYPPEEAQARIKAAKSATDGLAVPVPAPPLPDVWGLGEPGDPDYEWVLRRMSPHPLRSYTAALTLRNSVGNDLPRVYVRCTNPSHPALEPSRQLVRSWSGWDWTELPVPHGCIITHPDEVCDLLLKLA